MGAQCGKTCDCLDNEPYRVVIRKKEKPESEPPPTPKPKKKPPPPSSPPKPPTNKALAARKIQAWWRGTLVQRTLLRAALSAWIIQCWWRKTLARMVENRRLAALQWMAVQTRACVTIQSWVRMYFIRQRYCRLLNAVHVIQVSWRWHNCHTRGFFQGSYELTGGHLHLRLDIFLGSQICRISDCIPFPIKN